MRVVNIREIPPELALQREVYRPIVFVELLARDYVVVPGFQQLIVSGKAKVGGRSDIDCRQEHNDRGEHSPSLLQGKVRQKQNRSQLDCDRKRHQDRGSEIFASMRKVERREQQKHRQQLGVTIMDRHHEVLSYDESYGKPHKFRDLKCVADDKHTACDLDHR